MKKNYKKILWRKNAAGQMNIARQALARARRIISSNGKTTNYFRAVESSNLLQIIETIDKHIAEMKRP